MASISNGMRNGVLPALDGAISSRLSKDEGRFEIAGPYPLDLSSVKASSTEQSYKSRSAEVYDPDGFGDDLDDTDNADSGFSDLPSSQGSSSNTNGNASKSPAPPMHAPPPPPSTTYGATLQPVARVNPPITVTQTRRRARSEATPPSPPHTANTSFLSPPTQLSSSQRKSSPPASRPESNASANTQPAMPRLQQRHTLQVPQSASQTGNRDATSFEEVRTGSPTISQRKTSMNLMRRHSRVVNSDALLNEVPQDEDAARRADMMKQKLAARRRRKEEEDEDRVLVGTRVDQNHQNWVTAYNMLTGIRFTVSRTNAKIIDRPLDEADFLARHKYAFDVTGSELTPSAKYDFKFKDYAPQVFKELRRMFGIDPADYLVSLTSKILLSELASPGKSKSFFYFSRDYKYIIKTVHHAEHKLLRKILPKYFDHVKKNPNTLLSQFYGLHRIKSTWGAHKIHFVVMNNLFPPNRDIHQTFDLKGSTVGRELKEEDLEKNPRATLKDLNWMRRSEHLAFGPLIKAQFIQQMERDVALLKKLGIMDYSLLVGIHDLNRGNDEGLRDKTLKVYQPGGNAEKGEEVAGRESVNMHRTPSNAERTRAARELRATLRKEKPMPMTGSGIDMPEATAVDRMSRLFTKDDGGIQAEHDSGAPGNEIYYLGIIDCLTKYGMIKRIEHFVKGLSHNKNAISAVKPDAYGDRFVAFMKGICMTDEEAAAERAQRDEEEAQEASPQRRKHSSSLSRSQPRNSSSYLTSSGTDGANDVRNEPHHRSPIDDMTPQQQAAEAKARHSLDDSVADDNQRVLGTVRRSSGHDGTNVTLPVVEEVNGESNSQGDKSRDESKERHGNSEQARRDENTGESSTPRMPNRAAPQAPVYGGRPPPTPPKEGGMPQIDALEDMGGRFVVSPPV